MKTGRPREFDEEAVIENVMQSFWEHVYGRSTFEQLVSDSGLSRSSIYAAFGNKEALFNVAAQRYLDNNVVRMCQSLENKTTSEHSIRAFVQRFKNPRQGETKDCLFRKLLLFNAGKTADPIETHKAKLYLKRI